MSPGTGRPAGPQAGDPGVGDRALVQLFEARATAGPGELALRYKARGIWREVTWGEYRDNVERLALGLRQLGVARGGRIAVMGRPVPEWLYSDLAAQSLGATCTGIFLTTPLEEIGRQLRHARATVFIAESLEYVDRLREVEQLVGSPLVEHIIVVAARGLASNRAERVHGFSEVQELGDGVRADQPGSWAAMVAAVQPDDPARLFFTAGTTGVPKAVTLTSRNLVTPWHSYLSSLERPPDHRDRSVSYMPMAHVGEAVFSVVLPVLFGCVPHFPEDEDAVDTALVEVSPTMLLAFPRVLEVYASNALIDLQTGSGIKRRLFRAADRLRAGGSGRRSIGSVVAYHLLFRHLLNKFGFREVRIALTGGAPVSPELLALWDSWGLHLTEFYGLTECGGLAAVSATRGSVVAVPGVEVRLAADGELLVSSDGTCSGSIQDDAVAATIDGSGWLHTGDVGRADDGTGFRLLGRTRDLFSDGAGRVVVPTELENALKISPYVRDAMVVPLGDAALGALLGLDLDNVATWARSEMILFTAEADLLAEPRVTELLRSAVEATNERLASAGFDHRIDAFRVLPSDLESGDGLTPIRTLRRDRIATSFAPAIEEMTEETGGTSSVSRDRHNDRAGGQR